MDHLGFDQKDVKNLVDKLELITDKLTEQERMVLVAIFDAAAKQTERSEENENEVLLPLPGLWGAEREGARRQPTKEGLKKQLNNGFLPGKDPGTETHSGAKIVGTRTSPPNSG